MKIRAIISTGIFFVVMLILAMCRPLPAFAASTVTISSAGEGVFLLQGVGVEDAAAIEINVLYDTATLANPRVVEGPLIAGAMTAINPHVPGMVRMVIVRITPVKGSGVIATLTFDRKGSSPGNIISLSAKLANIKGVSLPALTQVNNPSGVSVTSSNPPQSQETPAGTTTPGQAGSGTTGTPSIIVPTVIIAGPPAKTDDIRGTPDAPRTREQNIQAPAPDTTIYPTTEPVTVARKMDRTSDTGDVMALATPSARKIFAQKSVLERFQEYKGERTAGSFISLFEQESFIGFRQEPPIALSDGKSLVKVTFISTPGNKTSSDVAVMGARLVSMKKDPDNTNTWIVELMPKKGGYRASLTVSQGEMVMVYPLTIAPNVDLIKSGTTTEENFNRYLKERGTAKSPQFDLNNDGKRDYLDDYIFTANYLEDIKKAQSQQ
jgi:hypothetical protein